MTTLSPASSGGLSTDFYAPDYMIKVEGRELDETTKGDVLDLKVTLEKDKIAQFDATINNWDDAHSTFKYLDRGVFDIGMRVNVSMGYAGNLVPMLVGQITAMEASYPESGPPTLRITALDRLFALKESRPGVDTEKTFRDIADWEIAQKIAQRHGLETVVTQEGPRHTLVVQADVDDAAFLLKRARSLGFECFIRTDASSGRDTLWFVRPLVEGGAQRVRLFTLAYGSDLISFTPRLDLSKQVSEVTVRSWNDRTRSVIECTARSTDLVQGAGGADSGPRAAASAAPMRRDTITTHPVASAEEARALAIGLLSERAAAFCTASGQLIGVPAMRPGDAADVSGVGSRFSGHYEITKVEHTLGTSGYLTTFEATRGATTEAAR